MAGVSVVLMDFEHICLLVEGWFVWVSGSMLVYV